MRNGIKTNVGPTQLLRYFVKNVKTKLESLMVRNQVHIVCKNHDDQIRNVVHQTVLIKTGGRRITFLKLTVINHRSFVM